MRCAQFRIALSARLDGEPGGLPEVRLDKHVARCAGCREWLARAEQLRGRVGEGAADGPSPEWSARLLARLDEDQSSEGRPGGCAPDGPQAVER
ncbi:zf-HC2 domain-containing protein [Kitasatospora sp. NPDC093102]|uniref:zf-HC2 domain-containing protein n=1 Tax=Kitasatospora sp. NPDC093102 TaxID=3155069 RepID=UPI00341D4BAA